MNTPSENSSLQTSSSIKRFGRYEVIKQLGEGAMGRVFLSEDPVLQRLVAIKVIALERSIDDTTRQEFLQRFAFEARASAKLSHPSIVTVYDAGEQDGVPWIAFEYIKGERLDQLLRREIVLPFDKIRSIILQIASALHHAQEYHIIHRDIKPTNILIDSRTGIAKLADFGVVKAPWIGLTQSGVSVGSPGYMSPEQIDGSEIDARSDLFSVGVVLYELIVGKHPFVRDSIPATFFATINQDYKPLKQLRMDIPADLEQAVTDLLKASRDERMSSASALIALINNGISALHGDLDSIPPKSPAQNTELKILLQNLWKKTAKAVTDYTGNISNFFNSISSSNKKENKFKRIFAMIYQFTIFSMQYSHKICLSAINSSKPFLKALHRKYRFLLPGILLIAVIILLTFRADKKAPSIKDEPSVPSYVHQFNALLSANSLDSAYEFITELPESRSNGWSDFLLGRIELKKGNYSIADNHFKRAFEKKKTVLKHQLNEILNDLENIVQKGKAPEPLIKIMAHTLNIANHKRVHQWLQNTNYWTRWNAVKVMESAGKDVDLVSIYLLDLNSTASMRTRIRAAEKLGELGDRRAMPLLQEIGTRGIRDPFVSATARDVLNRYFKNDTTAQSK